jgi:hypothetical protein
MLEPILLRVVHKPPKGWAWETVEHKREAGNCNRGACQVRLDVGAQALVHHDLGLWACSVACAVAITPGAAPR